MAGIFHMKNIKKFGLDDKPYSSESKFLAYLLLILIFSLFVAFIAFDSLSLVYDYLVEGSMQYPIQFHESYILDMTAMVIFSMFFLYFLHRYMNEQGNLYLVFLMAAGFYGILIGFIVDFAANSALVEFYFKDDGYDFISFFTHYYHGELPKWIILSAMFLLCTYQLIFKRTVIRSDADLGKIEAIEATSGKLGSGEFADKKYLKKRNLIPSKKDARAGIGYVIGKLKNDYITCNECTHSITIAPPREGKAVSKAIPLILDSKDAVCALDVKGELFLSSYENILSKGRKPMAFAPTGLLNQYGDFRNWTQTHFNPLQTKFNLDGINREKYLDNLVKALTIDVEKETKERHFIDMTKPLLKAMLDEYLNTGRTLVDMYDYFMSINEQEIIQRFEDLLIQKPHSRLLKNAIATFKDTDDRELSGIKSTLKRCLHFITSDIWSYCFSKDGLDLYDYAFKGQDLFICVDQPTIENNPKVVRMLFTMLKSAYEVLPPNILNKRSFPVILDEVAQLGALDEIEKIYEIFGDKGVRLNLFFQSIDQVDKFEKAELLKSIELKQIFGVRDPKTIDWIQKLAGKQTVSLTSESHSDSLSKSVKGAHLFTDNTNRSSSSSYSMQESSTELLHTDIIRELDSGKQIVFFRNLRPIICDRIFYYNDSRYYKRFSPNFCYSGYRHLIEDQKAMNAQKAFSKDYDESLELALENARNATLKELNREIPQKKNDVANTLQDQNNEVTASTDKPKTNAKNTATQKSTKPQESKAKASVTKENTVKSKANDQQAIPTSNQVVVNDIDTKADASKDKVETKPIKENLNKKSQTKAIKQDNFKPNASSDTNQNKEIKKEAKPIEQVDKDYTQYSLDEVVKMYLQVKNKEITCKALLDKYNLSKYQYEKARKHHKETQKKYD